jgi:hypothetical protein
VAVAVVAIQGTSSSPYAGLKESLIMKIEKCYYQISKYDKLTILHMFRK